eukprot:5897714-Pyramimonas_sp.AAC.1
MELKTGLKIASLEARQSRRVSSGSMEGSASSERGGESARFESPDTITSLVTGEEAASARRARRA